MKRPLQALVPGITVFLILVNESVPAAAEQPRSAELKNARQASRIAAAQAKPRVVGFRLSPEEALAAVDENLSDLEAVVDRAGAAGCDVLCLPEDTPGLLNWNGVN